MSGFIKKMVQQKPHAVCIPFPAQGHINPMLKVSKLLHHSGFHITFVHTTYNHNRLLNTHGPHSLDGLPDFQFQTIPDGLPPSDADVTQDIPALCQSTSRTCLRPFRELLKELHAKSLASPEEAPPVTCIISDATMSFTADAAEEIGVPVAFFWTASTCGFLGYAHFSDLTSRGLIPAKDDRFMTDGYLNTRIDSIRGMRDISLRDLPSFLRTTNPDDSMLQFIHQVIRRASRADAILLNTFNALEHDFLDGLSEIYSSKILPIGPLHLSINKIPENSPLQSIGSNLWKDEPGCITWLNSQKPNSVVYVNYGSITVLSPQQLLEFAWGLADSKYPFLWIIRPDLVAGDRAILPQEFVEETKGRGFMAGWCPQEQVLSHSSVGAFLTHCGWNSMLESIVGGVPMLCWPFFAEQQTNCWAACSKWGVGMEINNDVRRDEVCKMVRELMEGDRGKEMKKRAKEWMRLGEEAATDNGSSSLNFETLVNEVLLSKSSK